MRRLPKKGSIRNVVTARSDGYTGYVSFARLGHKLIGFESMLERDFILTTQAFEPDIVDIAAQPMRMEIPHKGSAFMWTIDYGIERACGRREVVEVKPLERVYPTKAKRLNGVMMNLDELRRETAGRFKSMERAAHNAGFAFRLMTEAEIRVQPRLDNAIMLHRYASNLFPLKWAIAGYAALSSSSPKSVDELQAALPGDIDALVVALRLAWLGEITFECDYPISRSSRFQRNRPPP